MPSHSLIDAHRKLQSAAKAVLAQLAETIGPEDTEQSIALQAAGALRARGIEETWYYDCPALVLLGSRSRLSISGRDYRPGDEKVGDINLVTVDLSPSSGACWGDCARSFLIEDGRVTHNPSIPEFAAGVAFLRELHAAMRSFARPQTTFHELALWSAQQIAGAGFVNLDFLQNVGHSLAHRREDRLYIEEGNHRALGEVDFFTFEPHVCRTAGIWGFKHEDIFFFHTSGRLEAL